MTYVYACLFVCSYVCKNSLSHPESALNYRVSLNFCILLASSLRLGEKMLGQFAEENHSAQNGSFYPNLESIQIYEFV